MSDDLAKMGKKELVSWLMSMCSDIGYSNDPYADQKLIGAYEAELMCRLARLEQLEKFVSDLAEHGLRCDLNPTHRLGDWKTAESFWHQYIKKADESVRVRASSILSTK